MKNKDGGIWLLSWSQDPDGRFHAWVKDHPKIATSGLKWDVVADQLYDLISNRLQAGEWTADWTSPPPGRSGLPYRFHPDFVVLLPEGRHFTMDERSKIYAQGCCNACAKPVGTRTQEKVHVICEDSSGLSFDMYNGPRIMRRDTAKLLGDELLAGAALREVVRVDRGRVLYVEPLVTNCLQIVAIKDATLSHASRCGECKQGSIRNGEANDASFHAVAASSVPEGRASFWIDQANPKLVVRREWWLAHRSRREFSGVISHPLMVIDDEWVQPAPLYSEYIHKPSEASLLPRRLRNIMRSMKRQVPESIVGWLRDTSY
jgi:hypothetical protein